MTQLYFFLIFLIAEGYLLTVMTYDRYVAIYSPLLYNIIMSHRVCSIMIGMVYSLGLFEATVDTTRMLMLSFCGSHISHYFCDIFPLFSLSCSSTHINEIVLFIILGVYTLSPILAVLISCTFILSSILCTHSIKGWSKAFGTCSSYLMAVGIFLGSITLMYFKSPSSNTTEQEKVSFVFYTTMIPMLNLLIYNLRNKDVKNALRKVLGGK